MKNFRVSKKNWMKKLTNKALVSIALTALIGTSFVLNIQPAYAVLPTLPADSGTNFFTTIEQTIGTVSNVVSEGYDYLQKNKEMVLDGIAFAVAKLALQQITKSTVRWINSGFSGSPAFVQDFGGFLADSADKMIGEVIYGSDLKALCSPFSLSIKIALSVKYQSKDSPVRCTLSKVTGNFESFLKGDFAAGGLPGWFSMTLNPNNNFFGAFAGAETTLLGKVGAKKEIDVNKILWGKGFLSQEQCDMTTNVKDADLEGNSYTSQKTAPCGTRAECEKGRQTMGDKLDCKTVTPGSTIQDALTFNISNGQRSLITADEINEVVSALFAQLTIKAFEGANGLLGLTQSGGGGGGSSSGGSASYIDRMGDPAYDSTAKSGPIGADFIGQPIRDETAYRDIYSSIVTSADEILAKSETCPDTEPLLARINAIRADAFSKQSTSDSTLRILNELDAQYKNPVVNPESQSTTADERLRTAQDFMALQASGVMHTQTDIARAKIEIDGLSINGLGVPPPKDSGVPPSIRTELAKLGTQVEGRCQETPPPSE